MAYTITLSNGTVLTTVADQSIETTHTSLTLVGRNYTPYGEIIANDLVRLLENFAGTARPSHPIIGQLWWDTADNALKVWKSATDEWILAGIPADGLDKLTLVNSKGKKWRIRVGDTEDGAADGMLLFEYETLNDAGEKVMNTVMTLNDIANVINGRVIYS